MGVAQTEEDDRDFLTALIEDNVSGAGREVKITGFAGALSSRATLDELTIADEDGVWLTMRGVVLDWSRAALLRGRIEIRELTAQEILVPRAPKPSVSAPSPEATGFSLPELPVSVAIEKLESAKVALGEDLFGAAATVRLSGAMKLEGGSGNADIAIERIDGSSGSLVLVGGYANDTRQLDIDMQLSEGVDGIVANLIGLPDRPAIDLSVTGAAPLDDFSAKIRLATDGVERLAGNVTLASRPVPDSADGEKTQVFSANIGGDIAPVFAPEYRSFFGPDIRLVVAGEKSSTGGLRLDELQLNAQAIKLEGKLALGPDGWPDSLTLTGRVAGDAGKMILLPFKGPKTTVGTVDLSATYDFAKGDGWSGLLSIDRINRRGVTFKSAQLVGAGRIIQGEGAAIGRVTADLNYSADGIDLRDADLMRALGARVSGAAQIDWTEGLPVKISQVAINGSDYGLVANAEIKGVATGFETKGDALIEAKDLGRFSGLAGQELRGAASVNIAGQGSPLGGAFDIALDVEGQDLGIGQAEVDRLLAGQATLSAKMLRDQTGTTLERFKVAATALTATADGVLRSEASNLGFSVALADVGVVLNDLQGVITLDGTASQSGQDWTIKTRATAPGETTADLEGVVAFGPNGVSISGKLVAAVTNAAAYSGLAKRPLGGSLDMTLSGRGALSDRSFDVNAKLSGSDLSIGQPDADRLLRGDSSLSLVASGTGAQVDIEMFEIATPEIQASASGTVAADESKVGFDAQLRDLGLFTPDFSGPVTAGGTIGQKAGRWLLDTQATGPGGATINVSGSLAGNMAQANLNIGGQAPLALANRFIQPRTVSGAAIYDLSLDGPLAANSLSGTISTSGARISAPTLRLALSDVAAQIVLADGAARISVSSPLTSGGTASIQGAVSLSPGYAADLEVLLKKVGIVDPALYRTTVDGRVAVKGPLRGGATISGTLDLGQADVQIPSSGLSAVGEVPEIRHVNEPVAVKTTRARAGFVKDESATDAGGGGGQAFDVDLTIRAPSRIFIRGRGLDAELGGQLRLTGTTAQLVPQGRFDLIRGRLDILGKRLVLSEGYAQLQGEFSPYLRLVAETEADDVTIQIVVEGTAAEPKISFLSSPELPEDEVLARLLFGRGISQISPLQAAQLASAVATLAGKGGGGLIGKLRSGFGLDDFDVTTDETGSTGVRAGKYLSKNLYTDVIINSDGTSEVNLNLNISRRIKAKGTLKSEGDTGVGVYFEKDY